MAVRQRQTGAYLCDKQGGRRVLLALPSKLENGTPCVCPSYASNSAGEKVDAIKVVIPNGTTIRRYDVSHYSFLIAAEMLDPFGEVLPWVHILSLPYPDFHTRRMFRPQDIVLIRPSERDKNKGGKPRQVKCDALELQAAIDSACRKAAQDHIRKGRSRRQKGWLRVSLEERARVAKETALKLIRRGR